MFAEFKAQVLVDSLNTEQLFQKYFVDSSTYFFNSEHGFEDHEYLLKQDISSVLEVHINDIYIVGSGKTGFSMKPAQYGVNFDNKYSKSGLRKDKSDIDVAIVSRGLFDVIQETIYDWTNGYQKVWDENIFHTEGSFEVALKYKFLEYLGKGWYRPDLAPKDFYIGTKAGELKPVLGRWQSRFRRKVRFAVYKNWHFFKKYQLENIKNIRRLIRSGKLL